MCTIFTSSTAALLIAAIVWQPPLEEAAAKQLDYNYFDFALSPTLTYNSPNEPTQLFYYLKVMALSMILGMNVRMALMFNLSVPPPGVPARARFPRCVTTIHKWMSMIAQLFLISFVGCYFIHALLRYQSWAYARAYV